MIFKNQNLPKKQFILIKIDNDSTFHPSQNN